LLSSPPERFFGFVDDVAARNADVVQVALAPVRQFLPAADPLAPGVDGLLDLGPKTRTMMIYHRLVRINGHDDLLKLSCCSEYLRDLTFPQTTLCSISGEIKSCIWAPWHARQATVAERPAGL